MGISSNISARSNVHTYNSVMSMSRSMDAGARMSAARLMGQPSRLLEMMKNDADSRVQLFSAERLLEVGNTEQRIMARDYITQTGKAGTLSPVIDEQTEDPSQNRIRDSKDFISVVLAGGAGSRFAQDTSAPEIEEDCKVLAPLDGVPLINHILNTLPTSDVVVATPGYRNPDWDRRIREALTPVQGLQSLCGKVIHYTDRTDNDWMESFSIALQKSRDLGYRSAFVVMGDSFLDANQKDAMIKAMLSPFENVVFYSDYGGGSHVIRTGIPDMNRIGRMEDYRALDLDSPEGRMEILYMISVRDFLSFRENNPGGGLDQYFEYLLDRQIALGADSMLGGAAVPLRHPDINVNTKAQLRELDRHVYGYPHTWWGDYSLFGRCYPDMLGIKLLPDIEAATGSPKGVVKPVQINSKGAVYRWKSHGDSAYIKIFSPAECGAMRHRSNLMAHEMFPELFPALRYHGSVKGYLVQMEDDLEALGNRRLDRIIEDKSWQDLLNNNNIGNIEVRESIFMLLTALKRKPFEEGSPGFRFPALQVSTPLLMASEGIDSFFPQPSTDLPIGFEYFGRFAGNIRGAFENVREKRPEVAHISNTLDLLCARLLEDSERIRSLFEKDKACFYSHGDLMPYNIFLPGKLLDGECFHVAPFSYELATLVTGIMGIYSGSDPDFIAYSRDFIGGFTGLFEKHEAGLYGSGSSNYVEHTPLLPLIALKLMQETYHEFFHCGLNVESRGRIERSLELAKNIVEWFKE